MSAASVTLKYLLLADNSNAIKGLRGAGGEADKTGSRLKQMSTASKVAVLGLAGAAVGFGNASINKFRQVTSESRGLQRSLGGTLTEASRMREAAVLSGVDYETFAKSIQKLDKGLVASTKNQKTSAAMTKTLGFNYRDASGHLLPMSQLLPKLADKFKTMADGPEKTALALQLFGKAGAGMLPFLGKGAAGIAELEKQSDKFGTTISGKAIEDLAKNKASQREWQASMDGLKVQIGAQLLPILNAFVGFIREHVMPIIQAVTGFVQKHKDAVAIVVVVIGTLVVGLKAWAIAQAVLNAVMEANPIALVVIAIAALAAGLIYAYNHSKTFRDIVRSVFSVVAAAGRFMWNNVLRPVFGALRIAWDLVAAGFHLGWTVIHAVFSAIGVGIRTVRTVVETVGSAIGTAFHAVAVAFRAVWAFVRDHVFSPIRSGIHTVGAVVGGVAHGFAKVVAPIVHAFQWVWSWVKKIADWIIGKVTAVTDGISSLLSMNTGLGASSGDAKKLIDRLTPHTQNQDASGRPVGANVPGRAHGGSVFAGMPYRMFDSNRPEIFVPGSNGTVHPSLAGVGGGGGDVIVKLEVHGSVISAERDLVGLLERAVGHGLKMRIGRGITS